MDEANRLKPAAELQKVFADAACLLGYKVLLYDGSFEDWSRTNYPVESGGKP